MAPLTLARPFGAELDEFDLDIRVGIIESPLDDREILAGSNTACPISHCYSTCAGCTTPVTCWASCQTCNQNSQCPC